MIMILKLVQNVGFSFKLYKTSWCRLVSSSTVVKRSFSTNAQNSKRWTGLADCSLKNGRMKMSSSADTAKSAIDPFQHPSNGSTVGSRTTSTISTFTSTTAAPLTTSSNTADGTETNVLTGATVASTQKKHFFKNWITIAKQLSTRLNLHSHLVSIRMSSDHIPAQLVIRMKNLYQSYTTGNIGNTGNTGNTLGNGGVKKMTTLEYVDLFNRITGYHQVEKRKERVMKLDVELHDLKAAVKNDKKNYENVMMNRKKIQKELDSIKDRKDKSFDDILQLTNLYKSQLQLEKEEMAVKQQYEKTYDLLEKVQLDYLNEMRERYVEEQMYSDKIRKTSTWWTWGLISTHFVLFLIVQFIVEPKKRKDLLANVDDLLNQKKMENHKELETVLLDAIHNHIPLPLDTSSNSSPSSKNIPHLAVSTESDSKIQEESECLIDTRVTDSKDGLFFWKDAQFYEGIITGFLIASVALFIK